MMDHFSDTNPTITAGAPLPPHALQIEDSPAHWRADRALPVALSLQPSLSWVVPLHHDGQQQSSYRIVARRRGDGEGVPLWDSGVVISPNNSGIVWAGAELVAGDAVQWAVQVADERGMVSDWSSLGGFLVPPQNSSQWRAQWISVAPTMAARTVFTMPAGSVIRSAILHFAGQGLLRVVVDGTYINSDARDPSDSALPRSVSRSYDVTAALHAAGGEHALALVGARGHLHPVIGRVRMLAELHLEFDDGSRHVVSTDGRWQECRTSLDTESAFYAEVHDRRRPDEWVEAVHCAHERVRSAEDIDAPGTAALPARVEPDAGPPVRAVRTLHGAVIHESADVVVVDLGENVAARSRIEVTGTVAGQRITVIHGELLDGDRVSTANLTMPDDRERERQVIAWTCGNDGEEIITPWFSIHGFRYVEIRGLGTARLMTVSAAVTHSDVSQTGRFESSDALLTRLVDMARRTQLNNTHAHPEDCPTREQAGWTGDAAVSAEAALCHLDMAAVYRNWLADLALDQLESGGIPGVSPFLQGPDRAQPADPVWGSALTEIPWQYWHATGKFPLIESLMPTMRRWADWQYAATVDGLIVAADISYGADWLALRQTPPVLLQTAAAERSLRTVAAFETELGLHDLAAWRVEQADELRAAARDRLWDPRGGVWGNGSQASLGTAIAAGWVAADEIASLGEQLRALVRAAGDRLTTGFAATQSTVRALSSLDGGSSLLDCVHQELEPGIGAMLHLGPGTLWETWWREEPTLGIASLDHIGLAAPFAAWAWTEIAGLRCLKPGFVRFAVDPRLCALVDSVSICRMTPHGLIEWRWERHGDVVDGRLTVPIGATAVLPDGRELGPGRHAVTLAGSTSVPQEPGIPRAVRPGTRLWLGDGRDEGRWSVAASHRIDGRWVCSPVFHEPLPGPLRVLQFGPLRRGSSAVARLDLPDPLVVTAECFVFALIDLDTPQLPGQRLIPLVRVIGERGTVHSAETRWLPVAWNRVSADLNDWPAGERITAVEVGVRWNGDVDVARGPETALPDEITVFTFTIGEVGWSSAKRTW